MESKKETWKYKILTTIRYLGDGLFYPFFALYLKTTGLVEDSIGFILSISPLLSILMNPIYSRLCSNPVRTKNTLMAVTCLEGLMIGLVCFSNNFYFVTTLTILMAIFGSTHYGLLDSLTTLYCDKVNINYSSIRVWGSGAYIVATAIGGLICKISYMACFHICAVMFMLTGVMYHKITVFDDGNIIVKKKKTFKSYDFFDKISTFLGRYAKLLKNWDFVYILIFHCLLQGITKTTDNFFSTYLETRGVSEAGYGFVYSYFVIFEVISLLLFNKFDKGKLKPYFLFMLSALCLLTRTLVNYLDLPVWIVIMASALRGIGYAIVLHVMYQYITKIVGEKDGTFAIMFVTLVYSIYLTIFSNIGGNIIEEDSYKEFYYVNLILCIVTFAMALAKHIIDCYRDKGKILIKNRR